MEIERTHTARPRAIEALNATRAAKARLDRVPDPNAATANVKAPVVLSGRAQRGKHVFLTDERYALRHPVFSESSDESLGLRVSCSS